MKIAVTYDNGEVFQHFGHCRNFKIYEVQNGTVVSAEVVNAEGSGHGALAGFLQKYDVNVLICGGIGMGARNALSELEIAIYPGVSGNADDHVNAFLEDRLVFDPETVCSHHHEGEHQCGEDKHGCGGNY